MKKLLALSLVGSSLLLGSNSAKSNEYDSWAIKINESITVRENTYVDPSDPSQGGDPGYDS